MKANQVAYQMIYVTDNGTSFSLKGIWCTVIQCPLMVSSQYFISMERFFYQEIA